MKLGRIGTRATVALAISLSAAVSVPAMAASASPWTPGTTVTYNANGGTGGPMDNTTYAAGDTVTVDAEALNDGLLLSTAGAGNFTVTNLLGNLTNSATGTVTVTITGSSDSWPEV